MAKRWLFAIVLGLLAAAALEAQTKYALAWDATTLADGVTVDPAVRGYFVKWTDHCVKFFADGTCEIPAQFVGSADVDLVLTAEVTLPKGRWYVFILAYVPQPDQTLTISDPSNVLMVDDTKPKPPLFKRILKALAP